MTRTTGTRHICGISGKPTPVGDLIAVDMVRKPIADVLDDQHPDWRSTGWISREHLQEAWRTELEKMISQQRGQLSKLDEVVLESLTSKQPLTEDVEKQYQERLSIGDRLSDGLASFVGSWVFISLFGIILVLWMAANVIPLLMRPFDPYPFILLNLALSCVAAIQAPLIMMSQGRQEAKDRLRSENDYRVNLKAELEIRNLHEKIDHHLVQQWERLSRIQEMQIEILEEFLRVKKK